MTIYRQPDLCKGGTVSDLHMLTNRTAIHEYMEDIERQLADSDLFIFNGDIFDFQWSLHGGFASSVEVAIAWIKELVDRHPHCLFVFINGNHDCVPEYQRALAQLARERRNFAWEEHYLRLGDKIFLHGDVFNAGVTPEALNAYRERHNAQASKGKLMHSMYWAVAKAGVPKMLLKFVPKRACARRIAAYLRNVLGPDYRDLKDVYFGHVHTPFTDFEYDGLRFHNTGTAVIGLQLHILRFEYRAEELAA